MAGLTGGGMLKEGAAADICLFDYAALKATADFVNPFRHNEGIRYVLVNGQMAVRDGIATGIRAGRMLKRG
jgi:N-acyl-D-amino-acid deacylase